MRARFADGVIADVLRFSVEDLCMGIKDENPKDYVDKRIKEDRRNFDLGRWNHVYIYSPAPKKQIIFGADGIYDVFQKMAEQVEFDRYAEEWSRRSY